MKQIYIIGAGANTEIGLPSGYDLKQIIPNYLRFNFLDRELKNGDQVIHEAIQILCQYNLTKQDLMYKAAFQIVRGLPQAISIDNFIDAHRGNKEIELCGKMAIVKGILDAEGKSLFKANLNKNENFKKLENSWYLPLFQILTQNCTKADFIKRLEKINFIVFNYDRCFEFYFYLVLQDYYGISKEESADIVNKIKIIHPYGVVGFLPFMNGKPKIEYGATPSAYEINSIIKSIKTFTEIQQEKNEIESMVYSAEQIVFLGFAYHKINLKVLFPDSRRKKVLYSNRKITCIGSVYNESDKNKEAIENELKQKCASISTIFLDNCRCHELLKKYSRYLERYCQ